MTAAFKISPVLDAGTEPEIELPPYPGIALENVTLVRTVEQAQLAAGALLASDTVGFDTESRPTFMKGQQSDGPHLIQLATDSHVYLFHLVVEGSGSVEPLRAVLESAAVLKVGFGLSDDLKRLRAKLGIDCQGVLDLAVALRQTKRGDVGAKSAVARFFGQKLQKSKKISTTNWALPRLSEKQIAYAADDAHVALKVYRAWKAGKPAA
ncbi:MAG TPA: 3'-5' exonuclease [Burkholderiaceae bacterium]